MSFVWFENIGWTTTLLTLMCFLKEGVKKYKKEKIPSFFYVFATVMKSQDDRKGLRWEQLFSVTFLGL